MRLALFVEDAAHLGRWIGWHGGRSTHFRTSSNLMGDILSI
jgi:hypothetical protein